MLPRSQLQHQKRPQRFWVPRNVIDLTLLAGSVSAAPSLPLLRPGILIKINQLNVGFMLNAHDSHAQSTKIENVAKQSIRTTKTTELKNLTLSLGMLKSEYP